jgi:hypothetical protein
MVPKKGVAIHINAFNFPIWGMLEKCAVNWMAGMPAVVLPAPSTSYLTEAEVRYLIDREWAQSADDILWRRSKLGLRFDSAQRTTLEDFCARV